MSCGPRRLAFAAFRFGLWVLGLSSSLAAWTDPFDEDDAAWTHWDPRAAAGAPALFRVENGSYHLAVTAGSNPFEGMPTAASYLTDVRLSDFYIFVDLVGWDEESSQALGILARSNGGQDALYCIYYTSGSGSPSLRVGAISTGSVAVQSIILDPTRDYRLVFAGQGASLVGEVYALSDLGKPLARVSGVSYVRTEGYVGLGVQPWSAYATADATYDNFTALSAPPAAVILQQPADQAVEEFRSATFSVDVQGVFVSYQWRRDDVDIPGATGPAYSTPLVTWADDGAVYSVVVSSPAGPVLSREAELQVQLDVTPPRVLGAVATLDPTHVIVTFSEPVLAVNAEDVFNYRLTPASGGSEIAVNGATLVMPDTVLLVTDPLRADLDYVVTIGEILDLSPQVHLLTPNPTRLDLAQEIVVLPGDGHTWSYFQSDRDPGQDWQKPGFDVAGGGWASGPALFDAKWPPGRTMVGPSNQPVRTVLSLTNPQSAPEQTRTYYFRTRFAMPRVRPGAALFLRVLVDDGAVFYLNGVEVCRLNLPVAPEPVGYTTFALLARDDTDLFFDGLYALPVTNLVVGDNLLAAEVHQSSLRSSDICFTAELTAILPPRAPYLHLTPTTASGWTLSWNGESYLLEEAERAVGPWRMAGIQENPQVLTTGQRCRFFRLRLKQGGVPKAKGVATD